jgi:hypothetical protein
MSALRAVRVGEHGGLFTYMKTAVERAMKVQEVILRAMAKKITW